MKKIERESNFLSINYLVELKNKSKENKIVEKCIILI